MDVLFPFFARVTSKRANKYWLFFRLRKVLFFVTLMCNLTPKSLIMKLFKLLSILLITGFLSIGSAHAQILKKLKKRVQEATEEVIVDKAADKAAQETSKALDSILEIDPDYESQVSRQLQNSMTQSSEGLPLEELYTFHTAVFYNMEFDEQGKSSIVEYVMWFSENENYMATQIENASSTASGNENMPASMFTVLDEKNKAMIVFMEEQKLAQLLSMETLKELSEWENESEEIDNDYSDLKKSGRTKKILGYACEEFTSENADNKFSMWVTQDLDLYQKNMFFSLNESLGGKKFSHIPDEAKGFMMEMHFENLVNGEKGTMHATKINKQLKSIEPSQYQFMNLNQFMQN